MLVFRTIDVPLKYESGSMLNLDRLSSSDEGSTSSLKQSKEVNIDCRFSKILRLEISSMNGISLCWILGSEEGSFISKVFLEQMTAKNSSRIALDT